MAASYEHVLEAVVVEVEQTRAPAAQGQAGGSNTGGRRHIHKAPAAEVSKQLESLIAECSNEKVFAAVVVVVAEVSAHGRECPAVVVVGDAGFERDFPEFPAAFIV